MRPTVRELLGQLRSEGVASDAHTLVVRTAMARLREDDDIPPYLRVVVGIGAWIATCFLIAFFLSLVDNEGAVAATGLVVLVLAVVSRQVPGGEFLLQASVAASFAGQGLIAYGIIKAMEGPVVASLLAFLISTCLVLVMRDSFHRFLSAAIAVLALAVAPNSTGRPGLLDVTALVVACAIAVAWRIDVRGRSDEMDELLIPVGYGLVVGLFGLLIYDTVFSMVAGAHPKHPHLGVATTVGFGLMLALLARTIFREHYTRRRSSVGMVIFGAIALLAVVTMDSPGIIAGVSILVLAFDRRNPVLMEMGVTFLLVFGAAYYYSLDVTLLQKAGILVAGGVVCLGARALLGTPPTPPLETGR